MEELRIGEVLEGLKDYDLNPIERVLAAHTGTVQLLLSLWFNEPVDVEGIKQKEGDGKIHRSVDLVCRHSRLTVAHAESVIGLDDNSPEVLADIRAGKLGIGQIAVKHRVPVTRTLHEVQVAPHELSRFYSMQGPGLHYEIRETFPRYLYEQD